MFQRLPLLLALGTILAAGASAQDGALLGRIEGDSYVSPTGEFKIPVPVLPELGGAVHDTENVVTFTDNFNTHISIACFPLDSSQKWELETRGLRDYLLFFFTDVVLADFQRRFPGASIESARFLPELVDGALITYALLPGGSFFEKSASLVEGPPATPPTAKRGTLLFVRNRYIFILTTELAERVTQRSTYNQSVEAENNVLSGRLTGLASRLVFPPAKTRAP